MATSAPAPAPSFDLQEESRRFAARGPLLKRHWAMRLDLAPGIAFQPETGESVEDQVLETLWAEGHTLETAGRELEDEVRASFDVLTPRRESSGRSVAATLLLGFRDAERAARFEALRGLPDQLWLELSGGGFAIPVVDGGAGSGARLPAVLALRYLIPDGETPVALVSNHNDVPGRWPAPEAWMAWN